MNPGLVLWGRSVTFIRCAQVLKFRSVGLSMKMELYGYLNGTNDDVLTGNSGMRRNKHHKLDEVSTGGLWSG